MALGGMKRQLVCMQTQAYDVFRFNRQLADRVFPSHSPTFCIIILSYKL